MSNSSPKAFVLGGQGGLLGHALTAALKAKGWDVSANEPGTFDYFAADLHERLAEYIDNIEPACIFNTVAYTNVEAAESHKDEAMVLNRAVPAALARITKNRPVRLVHFSTDFVFDGRKNQPYTVDDQPNPLSVYGSSKLAGEDAIRDAALSRYDIVRTAWLYGSGKKNFVRTILDICRNKGEAKVVFDQIGSPTYALDLANYTISLVELESNGLFHIVNSGQASWCELAAEAVNYSLVECMITPVPSVEFPSKVTRPACSVLDCSRFTQITGIVPRAWPQALREYLMLDIASE